MPNELGIIDLLEVFGFDRQLKTKLVRHQQAQYDMATLIRNGWFELYQRLQARPVFDGCKQIVSFIGDGSSRAKFVGVYRVLSDASTPKSIRSHVPANCPHPEWGTNSKVIYDLERCPEYSDLEGRLVIDWGSGALAWHQHLKNKPVLEILPKGRSLEPFSDYLDFTLTYAQLQELVHHQSAHRDWYSSLSAVAGIYLILAETTGKQYVGSAYGLDGIWGRWSQYAANGHCNNELLRELVKSNSAYPDAFRYSILQVLPKTTTPTEVIRWESKYKSKLGSRVTGLNLN